MCCADSPEKFPVSSLNIDSLFFRNLLLVRFRQAEELNSKVFFPRMHQQDVIERPPF